MTDLNDIKNTATKFLAAKKLELAAQNLRHYLKIRDEQVTLQAIVESLSAAQDEARSGNPESFGEILARQTEILATTFDFYLDKAQDAYTQDDKIMMALKAQRQMLSTVNTWRHLEKIKKTEKRTEQNAPLDR